MDRETDRVRFHRAISHYEYRLKSRLLQEAYGKHLALDQTTFEFELADDATEACDRLRQRIPDARPISLRVGCQRVERPRVSNFEEISEEAFDAERFAKGHLRRLPAPKLLPLDSELPVAALDDAAWSLPYEAPFVTISGSHLYGFPSQDSDFDLRGAHLLPGEAFWGLTDPRETLEPKIDSSAGLIEIVSHDLRKFCRLLLKRNGYVLEQLTSPLVVRTSETHAALLELVPGVLTRNHYHHYRGFYHTERREYDRSEPRSIKKLLYCYRVLMTGCVLLREGVIEANLQNLNARFGYEFLDELVEIKRSGELGTLTNDASYVGELQRLEGEMDRAYEESRLPEEPSVRAQIDALIVAARTAGVNAR